MSIAAIILGGIALALTVVIVAWKFDHKMAWRAIWVMSLAAFLVRSTILYYIGPLENQAIYSNVDAIHFIRDSFFYLVIWAVVSGLLVLFFDLVVPLVHKNFTVERTPPGEPDRVVRIDRDQRRSA